MTQPHRRSPSSTHPSKSKSSRPVLHRRGTSAINLSISKLGSGSTNSHSRSNSRGKDEETEFDMASFLNFCCRRKDSCKPLSASMPSMPMATTPSTPPASPPLCPRTIVAPMTPTRVQDIPFSRIPTQTPTTTSSDLDPTEWKPVINAPFTSTSTPTPTTSTACLPGLGLASSAAPSLSSSVSSSASDYLGSYEHRPLPPRHNPSFSGTCPKGVQLVVPHVSSAPDVRVELVDGDSDSGSIFPASSSVWEDEVKKGRSGAISIARGSAART
ncbi:hypothetical protein N7533_008058 [Penicillium manginii]|uniref:uncharacterized protein n=1 Tax=Penicillium manginii TaxID=203109 RepID=UPI002546D3FC|nr:uncharacterized protein N7533_008058 [Penicillium manginii]KAJ5751030.1 hypothetical protein N7533_008058 [Penicillium manginii]